MTTLMESGKGCRNRLIFLFVGYQFVMGLGTELERMSLTIRRL